MAHMIWATVNLKDSRVIRRTDIGIDVGSRSWSGCFEPRIPTGSRCPSSNSHICHTFNGVRSQKEASNSGYLEFKGSEIISIAGLGTSCQRVP